MGLLQQSKLNLCSFWVKICFSQAYEFGVKDLNLSLCMVLLLCGD
jgi:hypothetical protein